MKEVHAKYLNENKQETVSSSTFVCKPVPIEYCMCGYCMNVRNKLLTLEHSKKTSPKAVNEYDILEMILCPKSSSQRFFSIDRIEGRCKKCSNYLETLEDIYKEIPNDKELTWNKWERVDGKMLLVSCTGTKKELLNELVHANLKNPAQGTTFTKHIHTAQEQEQFSLVKENLPHKWVIQVMDFAKNRGVSYQEEVKAAFFSNSQITIHPIVNYYRKRDKPGIVKNSCIILSEDVNQDFHAVNFYKSLVDKHIESQLGAALEKMVVYSDGCSSQYKSKGPFADLSLADIPISRNFLGSEHGKSACDAEIGVLNRAIDRAIIGTKVIINNTEDLFKFCEENLVLDELFTKRRNFMFVKGKEIPRERPETIVKPIPNSKKIHNMENTSVPYMIKTRNLSCFWIECMKGKSDNCLNSEYISGYKLQKITVVQNGAKNRSKETK